MSTLVEHPLGFHRHQPLLVDPATLQRARRRIRAAPFQAAWRRLTTETDAFLTLDLDPPDEPAGYYTTTSAPRTRSSCSSIPGNRGFIAARWTGNC